MKFLRSSFFVSEIFRSVIYHAMLAIFIIYFYCSRYKDGTLSYLLLPSWDLSRKLENAVILGFLILICL